MHDTAHDIGRLFFETYLEPQAVSVLDVGSKDVNGTLRDCAPGGSTYTGVDLSAGAGVDVVVQDPHSLPFEDEFFDAVVSTSCFEHDQMFWLTFVEIARVTKIGGFIYINAPSNGPYHSYPYDNWRFYPDASLALAAWANRQGHEIELIESFIAKRKTDHWNDCVMVFRKGSVGAQSPRRIVDALPDSYNIRKSATSSTENFAELSEDILLLQEVRSQLANSQQEVARLRAELSSLEAKLTPRPPDC